MLKIRLLGSISALAFGALTLVQAASAESFDIAGGDLKTALNVYSAQTGQLVVSSDAINNIRTRGVKGDMPASEALTRLLKGTGFTANRTTAGQIEILKDSGRHSEIVTPLQLAQAMPQRAAVETVTVTSSKLGGADVQSIPIAITALSQEQLTATQTAGGPDLVKQVPNLTFTKTNFSGYSIQIRGIGTQAISVTTDPAVAVALNDVPFIRNHFFEQEFYDLSNVEILRGPQGTLYGRNATAGVVNLSTALPNDQFEAMASGELGNYHQRRFEGMINLPIVDDQLDVRIAGEWTKRQGYSFNELSQSRIDGRDLWSGRVTIGLKPIEGLQAYLIWEHFSEDDDRIRSSKQLCETDPIPASVGGVPVPGVGGVFSSGDFLSQGCRPTSLYAPTAFQVPNGYSLPYYDALAGFNVPVIAGMNPYASTTQSPNLRVIESANDPLYKVKNNIVELNAAYAISPVLSLASQTAFNQDFVWSTQDYNRFNTAPGAFRPTVNDGVDLRQDTLVSADGVFCDPQLGCSDRLVAQDLSEEHAWQLSQEVRLSSSFQGPLNFSFGGNYLHYETEENYFVFINTLTLYAAHPVFGGNAVGMTPWVAGVSDNHQCLKGGYHYSDPTTLSTPGDCVYIDPNPIDGLNGNGHNYFLSQNPYVLNSYALFGETYYSITDDLKVTTGLRWTEDQKHFVDIPSELVVTGWGYPTTGVVDQQWDQFSGRANLTWSPKLQFSDQTMFYGTYSHGYKAGGANPPGAVLLQYSGIGEINPVHPVSFKPEFVDAFELGTKNTFFDGALTFNGNLFYYNYQNYQISEIVDRTSINLNFDAHIKGAEVEGAWEPLPGLRFNFGGGWEHTAIAKGSEAVDLMDRTAGHAGWTVVKPFVTQASNCILPDYVVAASLIQAAAYGQFLSNDCSAAYGAQLDPLTGLPYNPSDHTTTASAGGFNTPPAGYPGFDPSTAPNNGQGFAKNLGGNELPNAPPLTVSLGAQYTAPLSSDWAATIRSDYYWQDYSWARVFNDNPYDRLRGYTNVNLTLILTSQSGWQVMLYDKNIFNTTAITGDFLNTDDTGLTTNVFLTDPKLIGIRVTKNW